MSWLHKLFGIRISEKDKTRYNTTKEKTVKIKKERAQKEKSKSNNG